MSDFPSKPRDYHGNKKFEFTLRIKFEATDEVEAEGLLDAIRDALDEDFEHLIITGDLKRDDGTVYTSKNYEENDADVALSKLLEPKTEPFKNEADRALEKLIIKKKE